MAHAHSIYVVERYRIQILRVTFIAILPVVVLANPILADTFGGEVMEILGVWLIVGGVLGRMWAILYIGGQKNQRVVQEGPYSVCRHPLYLFSSVATLGFGLMLQSLVLTGLLTGTIFLILNATASKEERRLRASLGNAYDDYASTVPRILPNPFLLQTNQEVTFRVDHLKTNFFDALVFLMLIPIAEGIESLREFTFLGVANVF